MTYRPNWIYRVAVSETRLNELTGWQLKQMMQKGEISSEDIVSSVYDQIRKVNPHIIAYITLTEEQAG